MPSRLRTSSQPKHFDPPRRARGVQGQWSNTRIAEYDGDFRLVGGHREGYHVSHRQGVRTVEPYVHMWPVNEYKEKILRLLREHGHEESTASGGT